MDSAEALLVSGWTEGTGVFFGGGDPGTLVMGVRRVCK